MRKRRGGKGSRSVVGSVRRTFPPRQDQSQPKIACRALTVPYFHRIDFLEKHSRKSGWQASHKQSGKVG
jgi:hypothetical protein